jgi:hypothetical protein
MEQGNSRMLIGRLLGHLFLLAALGAAVWDGLNWQQTGVWRMSRIGELWFQLSPDTLNVSQAAVQRYLSPEFWDPGVVTVLLWPALPALLIAGIVFRVLFRRR